MQSAGLKTSGTASLLKKYRVTRERTILLCEPLEIEDFIPQPIEDVSPVKWNIAHTTWFFEEMILKNHEPGYRDFDESFSYLFNSYYDTVGERTQRHKRGDLSRPTVNRVFEYRANVDERIGNLLKGDCGKDILQLVELGINHEQQHQELLLTDLKFTFSQNPFDPVYRDSFALVEESPDSKHGWSGLDEGIYEIGFSGNGFCFDNELKRHKVYLKDFEIRSSLTTNAEFMEFIEDGGYDNSRLWHSEGWDWVRTNDISCPLYWRREPDHSFTNYTLAGRRTIDPSKPVCHVSFYEAAAFAEWKGMRLPTEFEWEAANESFEWGVRWEWTSSAYLPYPGFSVADSAVGEYNGKFMINQKVLRGASCATADCHSRHTYRNFFHPHLRWQFSGIRLAR